MHLGGTVLAALAVGAGVLSPATAGPWSGVERIADPLPGPAAVDRLPADLEARDFVYLETPHSPGTLVRAKSGTLRFFAGLERYGAEPPRLLWARTPSGVRMIRAGERLTGAELASSWLLASFQGSRGWEAFDAPWLIALDRRPQSVELSDEGLVLRYSQEDSGYVFSLPLYGYDKPAQEGNRFAREHGLPSMGVEPWTWREGLPEKVAERCDWWAAAGKAFPIEVRESFRAAPAAERIDFRQEYRRLIVEDDWGTEPKPFAMLPPAAALARRTGGLPFDTDAELVDADYWTAHGPLVGAVGADRLEYSLSVLEYLNNAEEIAPGGGATADDARRRIEAAMAQKFPTAWKYDFDHGDRSNFCWNVAGDVWYPRALPLVGRGLARRAEASLRLYMDLEVLQPHSPYHGKFLLHGPGIGSWGGWGDAAKFMTLTLQPIWAYAEMSGDWELIRERWPLIRRFFTTPDEADWLSYGRRFIAEIGDEAAPAAAYARLAWGAGDPDEYLYGAYWFARQLVHLHIKQKAGAEIFRHQPFHVAQPMPERIYPTNLWAGARGWEVDGPQWAPREGVEHQSANRWVRFQDPDVGRYYAERLSAEVEEELRWYTKAAKSNAIYRSGAFREWTQKDDPHGMTSLLRLESLLLDRIPLEAEAELDRLHRGWPASDIAAAYAVLRLAAPRKMRRVGPSVAEPSPWVLGREREGRGESGSPVQDLRRDGLSVEPEWLGWGMPRDARRVGEYSVRSFGKIGGDFGDRVAGAAGVAQLSADVRAVWVDAVEPRRIGNPGRLVEEQDRTPIRISEAYPNTDDDAILGRAFAPETGDGGAAWRETQLGVGRRIDLSRELGGEPSIVYVAQSVWSPEPAEVYLLVGHQGGVKAWINGEEAIAEHGPHRPSGHNAARGLGRLAQGWNRVLIKAESFSGRYDLQFRLTGLAGGPLAGLRFAADAPPQATDGGCGRC